MQHPLHDPSPDLEALLKEADWIARIARSLVRDEHAALDLSQDVLTDALKGPPSLRGGRLRAWLYTVAKRKAARRNHRERSRPIVEAEAASPEQGDSDASSERVQLHVDLAQEIHGLDAPDRRLLVGFFLEGQSQKQLAKQEGCSPAALRQRMARAKARLRARLDASPRGPEGWAAGLLFLAQLPGPLPVPLGAASEPTELLTSMAQPLAPGLALPAVLMKLTLALAGVALLTVGVLRTLSSTDSATSHELLAGVPTTSSPDALTPAGRTPIEEVPVAPDSPGARVAAPTAEALAPETEAVPGIERRVQVIDLSGNALPKARAVWLNGLAAPLKLTASEEGYLSSPDRSAGRLFVMAPKHRGRMVQLGALEPVETSAAIAVTLQPTYELVGQFTIDGLAPGEPLEFSYWQIEREMGFIGDETDAAPGLLDWLGVATNTWLRTDETGRFRFSIDWEWPTANFWLPPEFLVRSISGKLRAGSRARSLELPLNGEHQLIDLMQLPSVHGRLVWSDDQSPVTGSCEFYLKDADGNTSSLGGILSPEGRFSVFPSADGLRYDPALLDLDSLEHDGTPVELATELRLGVVRKGIYLEDGWKIDRDELPRDLGVIEVTRHPKVDVLVRSLLDRQPVEALLRGSRGRHRTGKDGKTKIAVIEGGSIEVLAFGYRYVSREVTAADIEQGQILMIDLAPAPLLTVNVPTLQSDEPEAVTIRLEFDVTPFETAQLDEEGCGKPYDYALHKGLQGSMMVGGGWSFREPGAPGHVDFQVPASRSFRVGGLIAGRSIRLSRLGPGETLTGTRSLEIPEGPVTVDM